MSEDNKNSKPRISNKLKKEIDLSLAKVEAIIRHIKNVQDNCLLMGKRLIESGQIDLGRMLIARGLTHDNSKFFGAEWDNMSPVPIGPQQDPAKVKRNLSIYHHRESNDHHPEYWGNIKEMPQVAIAEMICDWKARSEEFGNSLRDWIKDYAMKNWQFDEKDQIYKDIFRYVDMICEKPFEQITSD